MKYLLYKEVLKDDNILSHVFLNCLPADLCTKIADENKGKTREEIESRDVDIELLINGHSVDPKKFFDLFHEQFDDMVKRCATKIVQEQVSDKFAEISNKLDEYKNITEYWAKDINWEVNNQFQKEDRIK